MCVSLMDLCMWKGGMLGAAAAALLCSVHDTEALFSSLLFTSPLRFFYFSSLSSPFHPHPSPLLLSSIPFLLYHPPNFSSLFSTTVGFICMLLCFFFLYFSLSLTLDSISLSLPVLSALLKTISYHLFVTISVSCITPSCSSHSSSHFHSSPYTIASLSFCLKFLPSVCHSP